ncbi:MAG TPA: GNAT family N-acetyltransferase [Candidatus Cloacimonas sp.]|nr:GNAT family N-acetyltransferase [Candidatus Cloacimonas sp.]
MIQANYKIVHETDAKAILELYLQAGWWKSEDGERDLDIIAQIVANSFCFVIATVDDKIVGMGRALSDGISDAYIQDVTVRKEYRGNGFGKGIMRTLVNYLKDNKLQWIGLISEPGYEGFYEGLGFKVMISYTPFLLSE